jgi:hypothetical protein
MTLLAEYFKKKGLAGAFSVVSGIGALELEKGG